VTIYFEHLIPLLGLCYDYLWLSFLAWSLLSQSDRPCSTHSGRHVDMNPYPCMSWREDRDRDLIQAPAVLLCLITVDSCIAVRSIFDGSTSTDSK
jgi:hypothetical protein